MPYSNHNNIFNWSIMYTLGEQAMLYCGVVALFGWILYGTLANWFEKENELLNKYYVKIKLCIERTI